MGREGERERERGRRIGTDGYGKGEVSSSPPVLSSLPNSGYTLAPKF